MTVKDADSSSYIMSAYHTKGEKIFLVIGPGGTVREYKPWVLPISPLY